LTVCDNHLSAFTLKASRSRAQSGWFSLMGNSTYSALGLIAIFHIYLDLLVVPSFSKEIFRRRILQECNFYWLCTAADANQ